MSKRILFILLALMLAVSLSLISCGGTPSQQEEEEEEEEEEPVYTTIELKTHTHVAEGSMFNLLVEWFEEEVTERTEGAVTFENFYLQTLVSGTEAVEAMQTGLIDFGMLVPAYTPSLFPLNFANFAFPFAPTSLAVEVAVEWQLRQEFPAFEQEWEDLGIKCLYLGGGTDYAILSRMPLETLADFEGKRIVQLGGYFAQWTPAAGIVPVTGLTQPERYEQLRTGVVDGSLLPPSGLLDGKEYEVADNLIMLGIGAPTPLFQCISLDAWNQLNEATQNVFLEVAEEVMTQHAEASDEAVEDDIQGLIDQGVTYYGSLSQADIDQWAAACPDTVTAMGESLETEYPEIWDIIARKIELSEQMGHVWPEALYGPYLSS
jgi:TRAP-type C4-dicarboxylate transport system substrate-binding protein